jgi:Crp-like helix-turn-helix domain
MLRGRAGQGRGAGREEAPISWRTDFLRRTTTMETTIRVMSGLRQEGLVEPARRGIVLNDRAALKMVARRQP